MKRGIIGCGSPVFPPLITEISKQTVWMKFTAFLFDFAPVWSACFLFEHFVISVGISSLGWYFHHLQLREAPWYIVTPYLVQISIMARSEHRHTRVSKCTAVSLGPCLFTILMSSCHSKATCTAAFFCEVVRKERKKKKGSGCAVRRGSHSCFILRAGGLMASSEPPFRPARPPLSLAAV